MEDPLVQVLMQYFNVFGKFMVMKLSKIFLITLLLFPIGRTFSFFLFNPNVIINKEIAIKLLVETILFVAIFSFALWHFKYRKK